MIRTVVLFLALGASGECHARPELSHTQSSPEAVSRAVLRALVARDRPALRALAVSREEFRGIVWPRLPASRPERNVPWDYAWEDLHGKSEAHLQALMAQWEDRGHEVAAVSFGGSTTDYGTFRIHRQTVLTLKDRDGVEATGRLFGSMIEMDGRFKVFSYVVD